MKFNFKGFGTPKQESNPKLKEVKDYIASQTHGYEWLKSQTSNDKEASQKLAQFVMRCLGFVKERESTLLDADTIPKKKLDLFQMHFARMLAYAFYTDMSFALAEFEPTGVEGMTISKTIGVLCEATDEQLQNLEKMSSVA